MENDFKKKMRVYTAADFVEQRWKNGRGSTLELAKGADYGPADMHSWRLSIATLSENGSYSSFFGYQRTQVMLQGDEVQLDFASGKQQRLHKLNLASFSGDEAVSCSLANGSTATMFNLMTAEAYLQHQVTVISDDGPLSAEISSSDILFIYALQVPLTVQVSGSAQKIRPGQLLKIAHPDRGVVSLEADDKRVAQTALAIVIQLNKLN